MSLSVVERMSVVVGCLFFHNLLPNLRIKWENAPAAYGAIFGGVGKQAHLVFAFGAFPLMLIVRICFGAVLFSWCKV